MDNVAAVPDDYSRDGLHDVEDWVKPFSGLKGGVELWFLGKSHDFLCYTSLVGAVPSALCFVCRFVGSNLDRGYK